MSENADAAEGNAPSNAELDGRITALDSKLDKVLDVLGQSESRAHERAHDHINDKLNRPTTIADEIRRQLEEQRAADKMRSDADNAADWRKGVNETLAGLTEQTPEPPVRKVERFMWGKRA